MLRLAYEEGQSCETKPIPGRAGWTGACGTRAEGCCTNKPNSAELTVPNEPNSRLREARPQGRGTWANVRNKPNFQLPGYPTTPVFHYSSVPVLRRLCETKPIRTTGGAGGMRKAPKRGHRVTNRTLKHVGPPASHGLLALETRRQTPFIDSRGANLVCALEGFLAMFRYNRSMVLARPLPVGLTLPFFPDSSPGPAGVFLKGNYPIQNTHGTAEPCGCSPAEPVVNGITICKR